MTDSTAPSILQAQAQKRPNRFELLEKLLSFLDTDEPLNLVLAGYFSKIFLILLNNKAKDTYQYVYKHHEVLEKLIKHIYSKSISELLVKILNVSEIVSDGNDGLDYDEIDSIRGSFVYKIV
jgi:hypothetical protein